MFMWVFGPLIRGLRVWGLGPTRCVVYGLSCVAGLRVRFLNKILVTLRRDNAPPVWVFSPLLHSEDLRLRVWGLGFRVWGLGFRARPPKI